LLVSLLLLATAVLIDESIFSDQKRKVNSNETIEKNLEIQIDRFDAQLNDVADKAVVDLNRMFNRFEANESFPYFIFIDGEISFWSTSRFVPRYGLVDGSYLYRFVSIKSGQYLIRRQVFNSSTNQLVEIFGFLPLTANIPIDDAFESRGINKRIFGKTNFVLLDIRKPAEKHNIISKEGIFLFSIEGPDLMNLNYPQYQMFIFTLYFFVMAFFIRAIFKYAEKFDLVTKPIFSIVTMVSGLVLLRFVLIRYEFPRSILDIGLFDPAFYASSWWQASLGDLLINEVFLLIIIIYTLRVLRKNIALQKTASILLSSLVTSISFGALVYHILELQSILNNSQWTLDIAKDINVDWMKMVSYLALFINGIIYFLVSKNALANLNRVKKKSQVYAFLGIPLLICLPLIYFDDSIWLMALLLHSLYLIVIFRLKLSSQDSQTSYQAFLYFFITAFVLAFIHTYVLMDHIKSTDFGDKGELATELLSENDLTAEYLLSEAKVRIESDILIQANISNPFSPKDLIRQKIRRTYLGDYFDKFDIEVLLFSGTGRAMNGGATLDYNHLIAAYGKDEYKTDFGSLFFVKQEFPKAFTQYYLFSEIKRYNTINGYVILKLDRQQRLGNSILPQLLVENKDEIAATMPYDYALYRNGDLLSFQGDFNYERDFSIANFDKDILMTDGVFQNGYHHMAFQGKSIDEYYIVSSPIYPRRFIITNFSVFFLFLVGLIILIFLVSAVFNNSQQKGVGISAKIQLLLNFAFFLPLIIVSIVVLNMVNDTVKRNIETGYLNRAESAGNNLITPLEEFLSTTNESNNSLENRVTEISQYSQADINLFNTNGRLIASNQSLIFENQILAPFANPRAMASLVENGSNEQLYSEFLGNLTFESTYYAIRSPSDNRLIGVLSMPFFESEGQLQKQQIEILSNILNAFTFIFIIFVVLSFFASRMLTYPFTFLTQKIKATTFSKYNEPLEWTADDEIGLMVKAYNRMLVNLEKSKKALALSEKESAWREMAQQVAHEIKNPLTPMKLKLQHLQRVLMTGKEDLGEDYKKPIDSILLQIDTLSDIATSFSSFAKMPVPLSEKLDIADTLKKAVRLFNREEVEISSNIPKNPIWIEGDNKMLGRIFNNLILNAQQSVADGVVPRFEVELQITSTKARVSISDNGEGIPEDIKEKIFIPKFSTKVEGSGIGLAIAKRGVEHAGGSIWFESQQGNGTTFYLEFPLMD